MDIETYLRRLLGEAAARDLMKAISEGKTIIVSGPHGPNVTACSDYIESQRPVGPAVTVAAAQAVQMSITATVTVDGTTTKEMVQTALETAVTKYLQELARDAFSSNVDLQLETMDPKSYTVLYNRIAFLLLSIPGVVDYTELTVAGGTQNITVAADELPVLTEVTIQ